MAVMKLRRGTRSSVNSAAGSSGLVQYEPFLISDENRLGVSLTSSTYQTFAKESAENKLLSFYFSAPADGTIPLVSYATFAFNVLQVRNLKTISGTITASFQINGTNITSLSGLSVTSTPQSPAAAGANAVAAGNRLTLVLASGSTPIGLEGTLDIEVA